ncbi:MAG: TonB family protein [Rhodocyclaceae bacterium]|nr:TonB family protein [Rhodocyclaceae bacterium]
MNVRTTTLIVSSPTQILSSACHCALVAGVHLAVLAWLWQAVPTAVRAPLVLQMRMIAAGVAPTVTAPLSAVSPLQSRRQNAVLPAPTSRPIVAPVAPPIASPTATSPVAVADAPAPTIAATESFATPTESTPASAPVDPTPPRFDVDTLDNPTPAYPALSRRLGEQGQVLLQVDVGTDGRAHEVAVNRSSGYPRLDHAALETVRRWTFIPARLSRLAIAASVLVPIRFSLKE